MPDAVRDEWLAQVLEAGGQTGSVSAGGTPIALTIGPVGIQVSSRASAEVADLSTDAAELLLYGNAGRTGEPRDFDLGEARRSTVSR